MITTQFHHDQEHRRTICVEVPNDKTMFQATMDASVVGKKCSLHLNYGIARCNDRDQFCKATGREVAKANIKYTEFKLYSIVMEDDERKVLAYRNNKGEVVIFTVCSFSEKVHFIEWMPNV